MVRVRCRGGGLPVLAAIAAAVLAPACLADRQGADGESCAEDEEAPCMQVGMLQKATQMMPEGNATLQPVATEGDREVVGPSWAGPAEAPAMIGLGALQLMRHAAVMTAAGTSTTLLIAIPLVIMFLCCCCGHCFRRLWHGHGFDGGYRGKGKGKGEWEKDYYDHRYDPHGAPPAAPAPGGAEPATLPPAGQYPEPRPVREGKGWGKDKDKWDRDHRRNW